MDDNTFKSLKNGSATNIYKTMTVEFDDINLYRFLNSSNEPINLDSTVYVLDKETLQIDSLGPVTEYKDQIGNKYTDIKLFNGKGGFMTGEYAMYLGNETKYKFYYTDPVVQQTQTPPPPPKSSLMSSIRSMIGTTKNSGETRVENKGGRRKSGSKSRRVKKSTRKTRRSTYRKSRKH